MEILFIKKSQAIRVPRKILVKWVHQISRHLFRHLKIKKPKHLVIVFVDQKQIKKLNNQFRGKNKATDILSFAPTEPGGLGELVLCSPIIKIQAKKHGLKLKEELAYLVLHGILHLLGFDHETSKKQADLMYQIQDDLFDKFNL